MRANDFTNKVYYTLIINGVAKVTKKDYLALERLAKDYKKAHPKDKIKIVHSQDLPEGLKSAIAKAALAGTLAVTSPNVPSNVPNTDKSIEYMGQGKSFPSTVQVVVDKDGKRRKYPADRSLEETDSTGMGGGSAGIGGGSMVGGPETYEEEFGPFKRKGKFKRTMAMTY